MRATTESTASPCRATVDVACQTTESTISPCRATVDVACQTTTTLPHSCTQSSDPVCAGSSVSKFEPPAPNWKSSNHYWFYGWAVTLASLQAYALRNQIHRNGRDFTSLAADVMYHMQLATGFPFFRFVGGIPDDIAIKEGLVRQTATGIEMDIIMICCTRNKRLMKRRPFQEDIDIMSWLMGEEPRWFEDYVTKARFDIDLVE